MCIHMFSFHTLNPINRWTRFTPLLKNKIKNTLLLLLLLLLLVFRPPNQRRRRVHVMHHPQPYIPVGSWTDALSRDVVVRILDLCYTKGLVIRYSSAVRLLAR